MRYKTRASLEAKWTIMKAKIGLLAVVLVVILLGWNPTALLAVTLKLSGTITTMTGEAITAGSVLQVLDSAGVLTMLTVPKASTYSISISGMAPPLLIEDGNQFGYSVSGTGVANIDPISDLIANQIYQAHGTSPAAQLAGAPSPPITISAAQIASATALLNLSLQQPLNNFKVKSGFDFLTTKFTFASAFDKFLTHSTFGGSGTATNTLDSNFGLVNYGATFWATPRLREPG